MELNSTFKGLSSYKSNVTSLSVLFFWGGVNSCFFCVCSTVSSIFQILSISSLLSECQALSAIWLVSPQWYQTGFLSASISFLEIGRSHMVPNQGNMVGGG